MRFFMILIMFSTLFLQGCFRRPPEITKAEIQRQKSVQLYVANDNAEDAFLIEKYREAQHSVVDLAYVAKIKEITSALSEDMTALGKKSPDGKITLTPGQAKFIINAVEKKKTIALKSRDKNRAKVDEVVTLLYAAREKNKINLAIATKLNEAIKGFDQAGIDMSAAQNGIDQIFLLLKKYELVSGTPKAAEIEAKKRAVQPTQ